MWHDDDSQGYVIGAIRLTRLQPTTPRLWYWLVLESPRLEVALTTQACWQGFPSRRWPMRVSASLARLPTGGRIVFGQADRRPLEESTVWPLHSFVTSPRLDQPLRGPLPLVVWLFILAGQPQARWRLPTECLEAYPEQGFGGRSAKGLGQRTPLKNIGVQVIEPTYRPRCD